MADPKYTIELDFQQLRKNIEGLPQRMGIGMAAIVRRRAPLMESYAKVNAPWNDQTGNARNTLNCTTEHLPLRHSIILSHGMPYGVYLETVQNGKNAVIVPTLIAYGPKVMEDFNGLLARLDGLA